MHWRISSTVRDDINFISRVTARMNNKVVLINDYTVTWSNEFKNNHDEHKRENFARKAANLRLREMVRISMNGEEIENIEVQKCCGNCEYLTIDNICRVYKQAVPDEFIVSNNDCKEYRNGVPF